MLDKLSEEQRKEYDQAFNVLKEQQIKRREATANGQKIKQDYLAKLEVMKQTNRKMFLLFTMQGCGACTVLKYTLQYDDRIQSILNNFEQLSVDATTTQTDLTNKFNVYSYPFYLIIDKDENIVGKNMGCDAINGPANTFLSWIGGLI